MIKVLHISDLHIRSAEEKNAPVVERLTFIGENYPNHIIIITGDIVDSGTRGQYERAYQLLFPFCGRILICPGNHSEGLKGNFYSKECARMFDEFLSLPLNQNGSYYGYNKPIVSDIGNVRFIGLDSNIESNSILRFAQGIIGKKQLTLLAPLLETDKKKVLYFHHHPFLYSDLTMRLKDSKGLEKVITGKVDVLLFGHKHAPGRWENRWNIPHILAADSLYSSDTAAEITIDKTITVTSVPTRRLP